jgi:hypothetical protein
MLRSHIFLVLASLRLLLHAPQTGTLFENLGLRYRRGGSKALLEEIFGQSLANIFGMILDKHIVGGQRCSLSRSSSAHGLGRTVFWDLDFDELALAFATTMQVQI